MRDDEQVRAQSYTARPSLYRLPSERPPAWQCTCPGRKRYQRHGAPWECLPEREVRDYQQRHEITRVGVARLIMWLEREFRP